MADNRFSVTLDGPGIGQEGIPVSEFVAAVEGVQDALRLMVQHLGQRRTNRGQPPRWVREESSIRLTGISYGSFSAELVLEPPPSGQAQLEELGATALNAMMEWDGSENSSLPRTVTDRLYDIGSRLREGVEVWYGDSHQPRKVQIRRREQAVKSVSTTDAVLHGWLREVNWDKRTAQLHRSEDQYVRLSFSPQHDLQMIELATRYVEVIGHGRFNSEDRWTTVEIDTISGDRKFGAPFDLESFLTEPNPKVFDPDEIVMASEPFDVDSFLAIINEDRDVGLEESQE